MARPSIENSSTHSRIIESVSSSEGLKYSASGDASRDSAAWQPLESVTIVLSAFLAARGGEEDVETVGSRKLEEPESFRTKILGDLGISVGGFVKASSAEIGSTDSALVGTEYSEPSVTRGWDSILSIESAADEESKLAAVARGAEKRGR